MGYRAHLRKIAPAAVQAEIDGEKMPGRQFIVPLDLEWLPAARLYHRCQARRRMVGCFGICPKPCWRQITMRLCMDFTHCDVHGPVPSLDTLRQMQPIDKGSQLRDPQHGWPRRLRGHWSASLRRRHSIMGHLLREETSGTCRQRKGGGMLQKCTSAKAQRGLRKDGPQKTARTPVFGCVPS